MFTRNDGIIIAIAVTVLTIGTATGSAYVMLGLAVAGLVLAAVIYRGSSKGRGTLIVSTAAATAFAFGIAWSMH